MTNNIEQIEKDLIEYGSFCIKIGKDKNPYNAFGLCSTAENMCVSIFEKIKSMQSQIDTLTAENEALREESDADESKDNETV